jgi:hypothetical protein
LTNASRLDHAMQAIMDALPNANVSLIQDGLSIGGRRGLGRTQTVEIVLPDSPNASVKRTERFVEVLLAKD